MSEWMPIETAPHDNNQWILVYETKSGKTYTAIFDTHPLDVDDEMGLVWTDGHIELTPTHWMPLPEPPQ